MALRQLQICIVDVEPTMFGLSVGRMFTSLSHAFSLVSQLQIFFPTGDRPDEIRFLKHALISWTIHKKH